jgi:hypothetical protein
MTDTKKKKKSLSCRILERLCGVEGVVALEQGQGQGQEGVQGEGGVMSPEEEAAAAAKFLTEDKFWRHFVNSNAVLLCGLATFMWVYYA